MRLLFLISRPFAVAVGIFILLNLFLAIENPSLATTDIWLDLYLSEPLQALLAGVLGVSLLMPHQVGRYPWVRWLLSGTLCGFGMLLAATAVGFYLRIGSQKFSSDFPIPLSVFILVGVAVEFTRLFWWRDEAPRVPPPARIFVAVVAVITAFFLVALAHVISFGNIDFRRHADAVVVFGARVEPDGTPCAALKDRLDVAISLYKERYADYLIMTGGTDPEGTIEPEAMFAYAVREGVPEQSIYRDHDGLTTLASAKSCRDLADTLGFKRVLAVTQYFHCARVKLIFERQGISTFTVPTSSSRNRENDIAPIKLSRESFFLFREAIAFPYYFLFHTT
ncbi:MAG: YdcF family protein [Planctomycetes bacterium]|nr:YdcF family protein [Planctomycetota bacterium]